VSSGTIEGHEIAVEDVADYAGSYRLITDQNDIVNLTVNVFGEITGNSVNQGPGRGIITEDGHIFLRSNNVQSAIYGKLDSGQYYWVPANVTGTYHGSKNVSRTYALPEEENPGCFIGSTETKYSVKEVIGSCLAVALGAIVAALGVFIFIICKF